MRPKAPCKECKDREFGCHDKCEKYKAFKAEHLQYNLQMAKIKDANVYFDIRAKDNANRNRLKRK